MQTREQRPTPAKEIAYIAVMCALLIGGQYVFSFVAGIEIVTLLLVCFSYVFGAKDGMLCAVAFSLLRCCIWGFYPTVILLYLIYYPLLSLVFGLLGKIKEGTFQAFPLRLLFVADGILCLILAGSIALLLFPITSLHAYYRTIITICAIVLLCLSAVLFLVVNALFVAHKVWKLQTYSYFKLIFFTTVAALCTICFTLLDDVITPLFTTGMDIDIVFTYFTTSLLAMLPQTACTIVTVSTLFYPLTALLYKVKRS